MPRHAYPHFSSTATTYLAKLVRETAERLVRLLQLFDADQALHRAVHLVAALPAGLGDIFDDLGVSECAGGDE
jgi:hypothetical protein